MLLKNAYIYRITGTPTITADALEPQLKSQAFRPCSGIRPSSFGWISPLGDIEGPLTHEVSGSILLCAKREDKIVPSSALVDLLAEKIERLEQLEGRKIFNKEKLRLKDDAMAELLPRALPRSKQILGYLTPSDKLLVIGTTSVSEAELFINCVRNSLGSFPVVPPQVSSKPTEIFTHWLKSRKLPEHFSLGNSCDLLDPEEGATITCRRQDLDTNEIRNHIDAGKICTKIGINWHGDLNVVVDKELSLKQIKLQNSDNKTDEYDDPIATLDAAFVNMTLEFSRFLPALFSALGGESREQQAM